MSNNINYEVVDDSPFSFQNTFPKNQPETNLSMKTDASTFDKKIQNFIQKTYPSCFTAQRVLEGYIAMG